MKTKTNSLGRVRDRAEAIQNPYWTYLIENVPQETLMTWGRDDLYTPRSYPDWRKGADDKEHASRTDLTRDFAWAIPSPASITWMVRALDGRPLVEIGAGTGYWAWMLSQMGVDVVAYDKHPIDQDENWYHTPLEPYTSTYTEADVAKARETWGPFLDLHEAVKHLGDVPLPDPPNLPKVGDPKSGQRPVPGHRRNTFFPVRVGGPEVLKDHSDRVLFSCWPPYDDNLATELLLSHAGDTFIFCGEGEGGCTGDDLFFHQLSQQWDLVDRFDEHTQWGGIHDYLYLYQRKET